MSDGQTNEEMTMTTYAITDESAPHTMDREQIASVSEPCASSAEAIDYLRRHGSGWWFDGDANTHYVAKEG